MKKIAIIGGGPAGFMSAISAARKNKNIIIDVFEKFEPLKTILYTGNGRCNLTNELFDYKELSSNYPRAEKFLYSVFSRFGVKETLDFFRTIGVETYTQPDNRVFPLSNDANTVKEALISKAQNLGINIKSKVKITGIARKKDKFIVYFDNEFVIYDKLVIATGGNYRNLPDSGYFYAKSLGHRVTELKPSLTGFILKKPGFSQYAGVSIKNAELTANFEDKKIAQTSGDFIFTHRGISGPAVFKLSSLCAYANYNQDLPLIISVDFIPSKDYNEIDIEIIGRIKENATKNILNLLSQYLPKSLISFLLTKSKIEPEKKASEITKVERKAIIDILKNTKLTAISPEFEGEIVTAGGVSLDEINSSTMESKIVKGLYFCGEVVDIDGFTGGFNLQACWSTGYIAGLLAATS